MSEAEKQSLTSAKSVRTLKVNCNSVQHANLSEAFADNEETKQVPIDSTATHGITIQHLMSVTRTPQ